NPRAAPAAPRHDPGEAQRLLEEAGWIRTSGDRWRSRGSEELRVELLTVGSPDNAVEQLIQDDLARIGVRLEIRQLELGSFLSIARAPDKSFDLLVTGIPGDLTLSHLASMFDSRLAGGALDYAAYHTPALDAAIAAARQAPSREAEYRAWAD